MILRVPFKMHLFFLIDFAIISMLSIIYLLLFFR